VACTCFHADFLLNLFFRPWRRRRYVPSQCRLTLNGLQGIISQKMVLCKFTCFNTRTINLKWIINFRSIIISFSGWQATNGRGRVWTLAELLTFTCQFTPVFGPPEFIERKSAYNIAMLCACVRALSRVSACMCMCVHVPSFRLLNHFMGFMTFSKIKSTVVSNRSIKCNRKIHLMSSDQKVLAFLSLNFNNYMGYLQIIQIKFRLWTEFLRKFNFKNQIAYNSDLFFVSIDWCSRGNNRATY
jgi:hypothetical protein